MKPADVILALFRQGKDTLQIADELGMSESHVYNEMHRARTRENTLKRGREASKRYWDAMNPDKKALYHWRKKMRQAGLSGAEIRRALTAINNETRSTPGLEPPAAQLGANAPSYSVRAPSSP